MDSYIESAVGLPSSCFPLPKTLDDVVERECQIADSFGQKQKRGTNGSYSPETEAEMTRNAIGNDNTKAATHLSKTLVLQGCV